MCPYSVASWPDFADDFWVSANTQFLGAHQMGFIPHHSETRAHLVDKIRLAPGLSAMSLALVLLAMSGCGAPFNVNPRAAVPSLDTMPEGHAGSLSVQAEPITDQDFLYTAFNANPIMAGVFPVWVKVTDGGQTPVDFRKSECVLVASGGASYKRVEPSKAFRKLISYYQIEASGRFGYRQSRDNFDRTALDLATPLPARGSRQGYLFFAVPPALASEHGFKLLLRKIHEAGAAHDSIEIDF
jgi:hypothetical protein